MLKNSYYLKYSPMDNFKLKLSKVFLFLCIILCGFSLIFNVTYSVVTVEGASMYPLLNEKNGPNGTETVLKNDRVVLNYIKTINKGDIIVVKHFDGQDSYNYVIKRLIATGGDTVEVKENGDVYVNDKLLVEDYVASSQENKLKFYQRFCELKNVTNPYAENGQKWAECFDGNKLTIPKDCVFYLGDNRYISRDCSCYGPVKEEYVVSKVDFILHNGESVIGEILKQIFN